jgi:hypothetical protein
VRTSVMPIVGIIDDSNSSDGAGLSRLSIDGSNNFDGAGVARLSDSYTCINYRCSQSGSRPSGSRQSGSRRMGASSIRLPDWSRITVNPGELGHEDRR